MHKVYWSYSRIGPLSDHLDIFWEEPESLLSIVKKEVKAGILPQSEKDSRFLQCPSIVKELNKTYVIKSPIDYSLTWDGENIFTSMYDQSFFDAAVRLLDIRKGFVGLNFRMIMFSDSSLNINLTSPYFSNSSFANNIRMFPGSYDISRWFRPLDITFLFKEKTAITIKKGDPLAYVYFNTEDSVNLIKFDMTPQIESFANKCLNVKKIFPGKSLNFLYNLFTEAKFNKRVLKLIKENTI